MTAQKAKRSHVHSERGLHPRTQPSRPGRAEREKKDYCLKKMLLFRWKSPSGGAAMRSLVFNANVHHRVDIRAGGCHFVFGAAANKRVLARVCRPFMENKMLRLPALHAAAERVF